MGSSKLPNLVFWAVAVLTVACLQTVRLALGDLVMYNSGIAFGLNLPANVILAASTLFLVIMLIWFFVHRPRTVMWVVAFGLIVGGGASNLLERFLGGSVADYIQLGSLNHFNLADVAIVIGIGLALFELTHHGKT